MAEREYYIGTVGPLLYDDEDVIDNPESVLDGERFKAFVTDGEIKAGDFEFTPKWRRIAFGIGAVKAPPAEAASWESLGIGAAWRFDKNAENGLILNVNIPYDYSDKATPLIGLRWASEETTGKVLWEIETKALELDDDVTADGQKKTKEGVPSETAWGLTQTWIEFPMTPDEAAKTMMIRFKRLGDHADDDLDGYAFLLGISLEYKAYRV